MTLGDYLVDETETDRPRLGACVLVGDGSASSTRVVLGQRGRGANKGKWVIPGGGVRAGEPWREAAKREVREETGLEIEILGQRGVRVMEILTGRPHRVCIVAFGVAIGGDLRPGSDLADARWFTVGEIERLDVSPAVRPTLHEMVGLRAP